MILSFAFLGPFPFIKMKPSWYSITITIAFVALGYGPITVSTFGRAQMAVSKAGYVKDIDTYLMISG